MRSPLPSPFHVQQKKRWGEANVRNRSWFPGHGVIGAIRRHTGHVRDSGGRDQKRHLLEVLRDKIRIAKNIATSNYNQELLTLHHCQQDC